ncbi:MAG: hypothetical protein ACK504_08580 [Bacteroidota bacterium]
MTIEQIRKDIEGKLQQRDYYAAYLIIDELSDKYLNSKITNYELCIELINQNQDLFEYLGASKQFESAYDLHKKLKKNRNKLFLSCLSENQKELKNIFKRCVGDFSID